MTEAEADAGMRGGGGKSCLKLYTTRHVVEFAISQMKTGKSSFHEFVTRKS